jgi:hypothetical protein
MAYVPYDLNFRTDGETERRLPIDMLTFMQTLESDGTVATLGNGLGLERREVNDGGYTHRVTLKPIEIVRTTRVFHADEVITRFAGMLARTLQLDGMPHEIFDRACTLSDTTYITEAKAPYAIYGQFHEDGKVITDISGTRANYGMAAFIPDYRTVNPPVMGPNCVFRLIVDQHAQMVKPETLPLNCAVVAVALRDIAVEEELFVDRGDEYFQRFTARMRSGGGLYSVEQGIDGLIAARALLKQPTRDDLLGQVTVLRAWRDATEAALSAAIAQEPTVARLALREPPHFDMPRLGGAAAAATTAVGTEPPCAWCGSESVGSWSQSTGTPPHHPYCGTECQRAASRSGDAFRLCVSDRVQPI